MNDEIPMPRPREVLKNRYEVIRPLAHGNGMGSVYEAHDCDSDRVVAVKRCNSVDAVNLLAFQNEACLLREPKHPALPEAHDCFTENGHSFIVMDYIAGSDLDELSRLNRRFLFDDVRRWTDELLDILEWLHTRPVPVIHRDIKPSNLKITPAGKLMLVDFGIAKGLIPGSNTIVPAYTPGYSPIEQVRSRRTDARSDLYSLGATVYYLLTKNRPVDAEDRHDAEIARAVDPLKPISELCDSIPQVFAEGIMRALAINAPSRPASALELRMLLDPEATVILQPAVQPGSDHFNSGQEYYKNGNFNGATQEFKKSMNQGFRVPDSWLWIGLSNVRLGGIDSGAENFYDKLRETNAGPLKMQQQTKLRFAVAAFEQAIGTSLLNVEDENRSVCVRAHCWTGLIKARLGNLIEAKRFYTSAIHVEPRWSEPRLCLIEIYRLLGNPKQ